MPVQSKGEQGEIAQGPALLHPAHAVNVAAHQMPAQPVKGPERPLQIDAVADAQASLI